VDRADRSAATVRNVSRITCRTASSCANVNDIVDRARYWRGTALALVYFQGDWTPRFVRIRPLLLTWEDQQQLKGVLSRALQPVFAQLGVSAPPWSFRRELRRLWAAWRTRAPAEPRRQPRRL
jgi:hypothetical protein